MDHFWKLTHSVFSPWGFPLGSGRHGKPDKQPAWRRAAPPLFSFCPRTPPPSWAPRCPGGRVSHGTVPSLEQETWFYRAWRREGVLPWKPATSGARPVLLHTGCVALGRGLCLSVKLPRIYNMYKSSIYHIKCLRVLNELTDKALRAGRGTPNSQDTRCYHTSSYNTDGIIIIIIIIPDSDNGCPCGLTTHQLMRSSRTPLSPFSATILPGGGEG